MDNSENNIDQIFKERFTDAKDFSLDPKAAWQSFESASGSSTAMQSALSSSAGKLSIIKLAAVFAGSLTLAGVLQSDKSFENTNDSKIVLHESQVFPDELNSSVDSNERITSLANVAVPSQTSLAEMSTFVAFRDNQGAISVDNPSVNSKTKKAPSSRLEADVVEQIDFISSNEVESISIVEDLAPNEYASRNNELERLEILSLNLEYASDILNAESIEPEIVDWDNNHMWFLRAGLRIGSGESNSFEIESEWKANPSFSFGYGFSLTDNSFITAELGWLRRSGNGIERTTDVDLNPLINGLALNFYEGPGGDDLIIHESLVATRMDYIHMPLNYNYKFAEKWAFNAGGFVDLLISAKNDGYIVYNNTEYQASIAGKSELSSLDGLNKFRYGAMIGAEREIYHSFSAYGQLMVPLNSAIDSKSKYRIIDETNRLVDLKIGVSYRI